MPVAENSVMQCVILVVMIGSCLSAPIETLPEDNKETTVPGEVDLKRAGPVRNIGSAVAPVVGAVVGPLLVNIAHGITNGITNTISSGIVSGYELTNFGHDSQPYGPYNVYLVNYDDDNRPYLLLDSIKHPDWPQYYGAASTYNSHVNGLRLSNIIHDDDHKSTQPEIVSID